MSSKLYFLLQKKSFTKSNRHRQIGRQRDKRTHTDPASSGLPLEWGSVWHLRASKVGPHDVAGVYGIYLSGKFAEYGEELTVSRV